MKIYVVQIIPEASVGHVSQTGYRSYEEAVAFVKSRSNNIEQLSSWTWRDRDYMVYIITQVTV